MASNSVMIKKLQQALNAKGCKLLYSTSQFYSEQQDRPVTMYVLKQAMFDEETGKNKNMELFKTVSQIQMVLFLRDMWYEINGWEIPKDNEVWERKKAESIEKQQKTEKTP